MSTLQNRILLLVITALFYVGQLAGKGLSKEAKQQIEQRYQERKWDDWTWSPKFKDPGTILVVLRDDIPARRSDYGQVDIKADGKLFESPYMFYDEKLKPGTLLYIIRRSIKNDRVNLWCETIDQQEIRYTAQRMRLYVQFRFFFDEADLETIFKTMDQWVKPFDSKEAALAFLETKPFTREIRLGMAVAEVESIFGAPETKVSLGQKVIYKYKYIAIEFVDGKVADVKF